MPQQSRVVVEVAHVVGVAGAAVVVVAAVAAEAIVAVASGQPVLHPRWGPVCRVADVFGKNLAGNQSTRIVFCQAEKKEKLIILWKRDYVVLFWKFRNNKVEV